MPIGTLKRTKSGAFMPQKLATIRISAPSAPQKAGCAGRPACRCSHTSDIRSPTALLCSRAQLALGRTFSVGYQHVWGSWGSVCVPHSGHHVCHHLAFLKAALSLLPASPTQSPKASRHPSCWTENCTGPTATFGWIRPTFPPSHNSDLSDPANPFLHFA